MNLKGFARAYIIAALWSSYDNASNPLDENYTADDIAAETLATMYADCQRFISENAAALEEYAKSYGDTSAGHDFWLTRNRHGAGFWDRGIPGDIGERLTRAAHAFGDCDLYVGDDGRIY